MKKLLCVLLAGAMCAAMAVPAMAEQSASVAQKNIVSIPGYSSNTAYVFAKIENTGDEPLELDSTKIVAFDANDNIIVSEDYGYTYSSYLMPGEYGYLIDSTYDVGVETEDITDFKVSASVRSSIWDTATRYASSGEYVASDSDWSNDYVIISFTNTSEDVLFDYRTVYALLDEAGNILFADYTWGSSIGVYPGSSVAVKISIGSDVKDYYTAKGIDLSTAKIDTIVFVEE